MEYQKYCFIKKSNTTFNDILQAIDKIGIGGVIIVDEKYKLEGIVTDGDVRRCVLEGTQNLEKLINNTPDVRDKSKSRKSALYHLRKTHNSILPIINENRQVIDVVCLHDVNFNFIDNAVVIMAGGLGTRLMPLTKDTPKPLLPVNGKPILERIIEKLIEQGFNNFYISINYLGDQIKSYFGDGSKWDVSISYIEENQPLGTAGALFKLRKKINKPFLVMNGDIITDLNFRELLDYNQKTQASATMCVYEKSYQVPFGVVEFDKMKQIQKLTEKPIFKKYVNMGIYLLTPEVLQYIPTETFFDMPTLFQRLIDNHKVCDAYTFNGVWKDIGQLDEYHAINLLEGM